MMIFVVFGIAFIVFSIMALTPGNPAQLILGQAAPPDQVAKLEEEMGLNDPFFVRFFDYIAHIFQGDFGTSYQTKLPVANEILSRFPTTLLLATLAMFIAALVGIPVGVVSAIRQYSIVDYASTVAALVFASIPSFVLGLVLMLIFSLNLHLLPATGVKDFSGYILPALSLSAMTMATLVRMTRSTMLEVLKQDYIRTARAKGSSNRQIVFHHCLRNAMLPIITVIGVDFGFLLGGAVVIEAVFAISGIGSLMITAIRMKDTPVVMGTLMFVTFAYSLVNLAVDILYAFIDPRIKSQYERV